MSNINSRLVKVMEELDRLNGDTKELIQTFENPRAVQEGLITAGTINASALRQKGTVDHVSDIEDMTTKLDRKIKRLQNLVHGHANIEDDDEMSTVGGNFDETV